MLVIQRLLKWIETATVSQRAAAAEALAMACVQKGLSCEDRMAAEAVLTLLLDDPSEKVRLAISQTLSLSHEAPRHVIAALAADEFSVAAPILIRSPLLSDSDLIDRVVAGDARIQALIAARPQVSSALSAAVAEVGEADACLALVGNVGAEIARVSFRRMIERHGDSSPTLRRALLEHGRLPADCRHLLMTRVGEALSSAPLIRAVVGIARAERLAREACSNASITLIEAIHAGEYAALVEHLRLRGELTSVLLLRSVVHGRFDFLVAALGALSKLREERVRSLLAAGQKSAVLALLARAGLSKVTHKPLLAALQIWRAVANGECMAGPLEVTEHMVKVLEGDDTHEAAALASLLRRIHLELLRQDARRQARALAA
ncbi:DUF2336 domain-containing protein [Chelativorans sp. Marseille-P2723]|uniref:DUF2336 domain-containing protein n=1 Tax=Chelativorans sp. Marseille-P2723 TaxID=2709133 RepID=UPI001FEDD376|nr:DUF2336 domain-containing protein [Chelativorans sp. Marseille-P2723]